MAKAQSQLISVRPVISQITPYGLRFHVSYDRTHRHCLGLNYGHFKKALQIQENPRSAKSRKLEGSHLNV